MSPHVTLTFTPGEHTHIKRRRVENSTVKISREEMTNLEKTHGDIDDLEPR